MPDLFIKKTGQAEFNVEDQVTGMHYLQMARTPPTMVGTYVTNAGQDGERKFGQSAYGPGTITLSFYYEGYDYNTFRLATHDIYRLLSDRDFLRIRDSIEPGIVAMVEPETYEMTKQGVSEYSFDVPCDVKAAHRQSLYRSDSPYLWQSGAWQFGMNIPFDEACHQYVFTGNNCSVYNPSDIDIDPYWQRHDLKITIKAVGSPKLINVQNGSTFQYNGTMTANDTLVLDGVTALLNGTDVTKDTNLGYLKLDRLTMNQIAVTGCTVKEIRVSFPFLYL